MKPTTAQRIIGEVVKSYNAIAGEFNSSRVGLWEGFEDFLSYVKDGDRVLDAGCGNGRLVKLFTSKHIDYTGCDVSEELLAAAHKNFPNQHFVAGSLLQLPFDDHTFDVVFCIASFHHLPGRENRLKALAELSRVLKPGGTIIMTNWDLFTRQHLPRLIVYTLKKTLRLSDLDWRDVYVPWKHTTQRYYHAFTLGELRGLFEKSRFTVTQMSRIGTREKNLVIIGKKD